MQATLTKHDELLSWIRDIKVFSSVDARKWGLDHFYTRADRTVRELAENGTLRRIDPLESILRGLRKEGNAPIAWYEVVS